jgi:hypothetical protein
MSIGGTSGDTFTNKLTYYSIPPATPTQQTWWDLYSKLTTTYSGSYGGKAWTKFQAADFTSMTISQVNITTGTTGATGTMVISPIAGSLFYSSSVTIYWSTYNYAA